MGACATLGMGNQDALNENLESDSFLNSALQRFTCKLYYRFGWFSAPLGIGLIMSRRFLLEQNITSTKNGGTMDLSKETSEGLAAPSKYAVLGAAMAAELMIGFWFGIGVILAVGVVDSLNYCLGALTSSRSE